MNSREVDSAAPAVKQSTISGSHLATLSSSHCMHELKMQMALFIPVMTSLYA